MVKTLRKSQILIRIAAAVLCVLLVFCILPTSVFALEGTTGELDWKLWGGTLTISGKGAMLDYSDAFMPPWYGSATAVNRIVVQEGVTSIGSLAFYGCENVSFVVLPSTVTSIGDRAFKNCDSLKYLNIPSSLESIGEASFESCESLNGIVLPNGLNRIEHYAFMRCNSLTSIMIPASVTYMGKVVFAYCTSLSQAVIRCPISKVPDWTFYGCTSLNSISLPETVSEVGELTFHDCSNLVSIYYSGDDVEVIEESILSDSTTVNVIVLDNEIILPGSSENSGGSEGSENWVDTGNDPSGSETPEHKSSRTDYDFNTDTGITTIVSATDNATITHTVTTGYEYTVNGENASYDDVMQSSEEDDINVVGKSTSQIDAIVNNEKGWDELVSAVTTTVNANEKQEVSETVKVNVQLNDSTITGAELGKLAGKDVTVTITTDDGDTWIINEKNKTRGSFEKGKEYDLDYTVTRLDENKTGIPTGEVYNIEFSDDMGFASTVGINLKVGNSHKYATLYKKSGGKYEERQTVVVDSNGIAWFGMEKVEKGDSYYVGINVEGVDRSEAIVPESLWSNYGGNILVDSSGNAYEITGRTSSWGITGGEFALYAGIGIGSLALIVSLVMIIMNKLKKQKMKYALQSEADSSDEDFEELDEDELRLKIMKEMLDEANKKNGN